MALAEISFVKTWYTVPRHSGTFTYSCKAGGTEIVPTALRDNVIGTDFHLEMSIPFGYYETMQSLVEALNTEVEEKSSQPIFPVIMKQSGNRFFTKLEHDK